MSIPEAESMHPDSQARLRSEIGHLLIRLDELQQSLAVSRAGLARVAAITQEWSASRPLTWEARLELLKTTLLGFGSEHPRWSLGVGLPPELSVGKGHRRSPDSSTALPAEWDLASSATGFAADDYALLLRLCDGELLPRGDRDRVQILLRSNSQARDFCESALGPAAAATAPDPATRLFELLVLSADTANAKLSGPPQSDSASEDMSSQATLEAAIFGRDQVIGADFDRAVLSSTEGGGAAVGLSGGLANELLGALRESMSRRRKPVLVLGSGVLDECGYGRFADWTRLLEEVANRSNLSFDEAFAREHPTLFWESMLVQAAKRDGLQANQTEARLLRFVRELLEGRDAKCDATSFVTLQASESFRSIVALNFTTAPILNTRALSAPEALTPFPSFAGTKCRVWCPHGNHRIPASMRLGARKYSRLTADLEQWRAEYHQARSGGSAMIESEDLGMGVRFIADVLESPLVFAGCGLRHAEWTIWWLLATKARNEARFQTCPSVFVTADPLPSAQRAALESLNCRVLKTSSHSEVWAFVNQVAVLHPVSETS
jgi:hypothetical protein